LTRLKEDDINEISMTLLDYDKELVKKTGLTLSELAAYAVGSKKNGLDCNSYLVAVIPMTCGQGIIRGFSESVASIINHLGFRTTITKFPDAGGVAEAVQSGADILFMADDQRFVAINLRTGVVSDNGEATGKGYAAGLERICEGLKGKRVLVLGAGPVGTSAVLSLANYKAEVFVFDPSISAQKTLADKMKTIGYKVNLESDLESALKNHHLIIDACPAGHIILSHHLKGETILSAPGIPLGIESAAIEQISSRLLHDPLQIGVAVMLFEVLITQL
jgi:3-methylornithyl-N6-L-lysine dehydrogenase